MQKVIDDKADELEEIGCQSYIIEPFLFSASQPSGELGFGAWASGWKGSVWWFDMNWW